MNNLRKKFDDLRLRFSRLSQREQFLVLGVSAAGVFFVILVIGLTLATAVARAEHRVKVKADQLAEVITLQSVYKAQIQAREARLQKLGRTNLRLVSVVEDVARQSGVEIGQLRPEEGEATAEGLIESRVDLRAANLSVDRLQDFLTKLETHPATIVVRRLRIDRPYGRDSANIEVTVTSLRRAS